MEESRWDARECKVDFSPQKMDVVLLLEKPIKAKVMLKGSPRYNEAESKLTSTSWILT
jgi:hypothetical protein